MNREQLRAAAAATLRAIAAQVDARDAALGVGLSLLAFGLLWVWPPLALIVPGGTIAAVAIFGVR